MKKIFVVLLILFLSALLFAEAKKTLNPNVGLVGSFLIQQNSDGKYIPGIDGTELAISTLVDPHSMGIFTLIPEDDKIEIEEAFLSLTTRHSELEAKMGRMRVAFNSLTNMHKEFYPCYRPPKIY